MVFLGLGLGNRKTNEGNGLRGYLQCSSAREIEGWGSAASSPRRRRGGGREEVLGSPGWRGEGWRLQREATGGGGGRPRRVGASARRINGRNGREGAGGGAVGGVGGENRAGRWVMEIRAILQLPKIPGTKL